MTFSTISPRQIQILNSCCYNTARKRWQTIKDALGLDQKQPLMLRHLAAYWSVPAEELAQALNIKYKKVG